MSKRKTLTLTDKAAELLPKMAGYRDQGAYVSELIESVSDTASTDELLQLRAASQRRLQMSLSDITDAQELLTRLENANLETVRQVLGVVILELVELKGRRPKNR